MNNFHRIIFSYENSYGRLKGSLRVTEDNKEKIADKIRSNKSNVNNLWRVRGEQKRFLDVDRDLV